MSGFIPSISVKTIPNIDVKFYTAIKQDITQRLLGKVLPNSYGVRQIHLKQVIFYTSCVIFPLCVLLSPLI